MYIAIYNNQINYVIYRNNILYITLMLTLLIFIDIELLTQANKYVTQGQFLRGRFYFKVFPSPRLVDIIILKNSVCPTIYPELERE